MAGHDSIPGRARHAIGVTGRAIAGMSMIAAVGLASCAQSLVPEQSSSTAQAAVVEAPGRQQGAQSKLPVVEGSHLAASSKSTDNRERPVASNAASASGAAITTGSVRSTRGFRDCLDCPEMIELPAGRFMMGSDEFDEDRGTSLAEIAKPFAAGKFEVTFAEWQACVVDGGCAGNTAPSDEGWGRERRPIVNVSWDDAKQYAAWLSRKTGSPYRLLTDAEWEYAARAGSKARWSFGSVERRLRDFAWFDVNAGGKTHPVGGKTANAFGLHDMHGNVWEWVDACRDEFRTAAATEGAAPTTKRHTECEIRGGSWNSRAGHVRSAQYDDSEPANRSNDIGFRVARDVE